jgi:hypothetical protein
MNNPTILQIMGYSLQIGAIIFFALAHYQNAIKQKDQRIEQMKAILQPKPIDKEFPIKIIAGRIEDGVINLPVGKYKYPRITDDASTIFTRTEFDEKKRDRYDTDLFFYLFLKWMNSNFHQGWLLLHDEPVIERSQWHEPLADKNVDNTNILKFDQLPSEIKNDNIFFSNPDLFEDGKFKFALHTKFPIEEFAIVLPPETRISFPVNSQEGTKIILNNAYCIVTFQLTACSSGPGLPIEMLDPTKGFSTEESYKYLTINYQVSFRAWFEDTENFDDQHKVSSYKLHQDFIKNIVY